MACAAIADSYPAVTGASGADFAFSADSCLEQAEAPTNTTSAKSGIPAGRAKRLICFPLSSRLPKRTGLCQENARTSLRETERTADPSQSLIHSVTPVSTEKRTPQ